MIAPPAPTIGVIGPDLMAYSLIASLQARGIAAVALSGVPAALVTIAPESAPAAIVLDLLIARRDDYALLRAIRASGPLAHLPILVLANGTLGSEITLVEQRPRSFGTRFLLTPPDLDAVIDELARVLPSAA